MALLTVTYRDINKGICEVYFQISDGNFIDGPMKTNNKYLFTKINV